MPDGIISFADLCRAAPSQHRRIVSLEYASERVLRKTFIHPLSQLGIIRKCPSPVNGSVAPCDIRVCNAPCLNLQRCACARYPSDAAHRARGSALYFEGRRAQAHRRFRMSRSSSPMPCACRSSSNSSITMLIAVARKSKTTSSAMAATSPSSGMPSCRNSTV